MKLPDRIDIAQFDYPLTERRIAHYPLEKRSDSKLLVYSNRQIEEKRFSDLPVSLPANSKIFINDTRVIHARLLFRKETGAIVEIFCLHPHNPSDYQLSFSAAQSCTWECLVGNNRKWKSGSLQLTTLIDEKPVTLTATKSGSSGNSQLIHFSWNGEVSFGKISDSLGNIPIPPYLNRNSEPLDRQRYQTVYSNLLGSVAAPTAGLHFTAEIMDELRSARIDLHPVTLHVGAGTFQPVKNDNAREHDMHREYFRVEKATVQALIDSRGKRIATGTTTLRTLESLYWLGVKSMTSGQPTHELGQWDYTELPGDIPINEALGCLLRYMGELESETYEANTAIMIVPGYRFQAVDGLITNFHQPRSTLLLLIAAFVGANWRSIYNYALENDFRFLSYGDSSLLWR